MATSGAFLTSDSGQGGGGYYGQLRFEWWRTGWGRSGSVGYHNISYNLKTYGGYTTYWQNCYNSSMSVDGTGYSAGTIKAYGGGATTLLSGSKTLYTNTSGNRSFGASAQAGIYTAAINTSGSGSWALDNIPMLPVISSTSGNINDETDPIRIYFTNPAGGSTTGYLFAKKTTEGTWVTVATRSSYGSGVNFNLTTTERNLIRARLHDVNSGNFKYRVANSIGSVDSDKTVSIINANPTFADFTYKDTNATTTTITGNDQYIIQGHSTLQAKVSVANKATANKSATMVKYLYTVSGLSSEKTWSNTVDVDNDIGVLTASTNQTLTVTARDSRTNQTAVSKTVNVVPYTAPVVNATAVRQNNFEATTDITIAGTVSMLDVAGTKKNTVNSASGVQYRYREAGGTWGSWTDRASSLNTTTGAVTTTDFTLSLDNTMEYEFEFKITDVLTSTTSTVTVSRGIAIMRISTSDDKIYNKEQPLMPSHVGMIIHSTSLTTAGAVQAIYGGTWVAWGVGRVLVGVDTGQTEFNTVEKTGGNKNLQSHTHDMGSITLRANVGNYANGQTNLDDWAGSGGPISATNVQVGNGWSGTMGTAGSGSSQNLQPYITAYMWKRTV